MAWLCVQNKRIVSRYSAFEEILVDDKERPKMRCSRRLSRDTGRETQFGSPPLPHYSSIITPSSQDSVRPCTGLVVAAVSSAEDR